MKKNNTAYFILSTGDPLCPGSCILFSFVATRQDNQGVLCTLNLNVTHF